MSSKSSGGLGTKHEEAAQTDQEDSANVEYDISVEKLLRQSSKLLIKTLDNFQDGIFALDTDWNFTYLNKRAASIVGLKSKDLVGKNIWETFPQIKNSSYEENYRSAMQNQEIRNFEAKNIAGEIWFNITVYPSKEGLIVHWQDITERKRAEEALKASEEQFRRAIEESPIPVIMQAEDGQVLQISRTWTELTGYTIAEVQTFDEWLTKAVYDGADKIRDHMHELFKGNESSIGVEFTVRTRDGAIRCWSFSASSPGTLRDGRRFIVGMAIDVTERNQTEEALRHAQAKLKKRAKNLKQTVEDRTKKLQDAEHLATIGQIAGMVGHDIRNPLQAIVSELYFARQAIAEAPENVDMQGASESINTIQEQVDYISKIVSDLQDYARTLQPTLVEVNICQLIPEALKTVPIPQKIEVIAECEEPTLTLKLDPAFMRRILTNLATNAIQAMPNGGKLSIKACQKEAKATITIEDTGIGIPEEVKPKLFTLLFTTKAKGQGFGLAVVKRLVEAQGGTISLESKVGVGTKFIVKLPV